MSGTWLNRTSPKNKSFEEIKKIISEKLRLTHSMLRQSGVPAQPVKPISHKDK